MQMIALRPKAPATIPRSHPLSAGAVREADIMVRSVMSVRIVPNLPFYFHLEFLSAQMSTETPPLGRFCMPPISLSLHPSNFRNHTLNSFRYL